MTGLTPILASRSPTTRGSGIRHGVLLGAGHVEADLGLVGAMRIELGDDPALEHDDDARRQGEDLPQLRRT